MLFRSNGERIQWGPAPFDPRWMEIDPLELTCRLKPGPNLLASTVLFFGFGDGTWPLGKPGFIFRLEIEYDGGSREMVISDDSWKSLLARAAQHPLPGRELGSRAPTAGMLSALLEASPAGIL